MNNNRLFYLIIGIVFLGVAACTKIKDFERYADGKELYYTGKIDSVIIYSGINRVKVEGLLISDPKIKEVLVYWNSRQDSMRVPVTRTQGVDTVSFFIDSLAEGLYNFEIFTLDNFQNRSIVVNSTGTVYGAEYLNSVTTTNRIMTRYKYWSTGSIIEWGTMDLTTGAYATEVIYTDTTEQEQSIIVPIKANSTTLYASYNNPELRYRTLYLPDTISVDTVKSEFKKVVLDTLIGVIPKSRFAAMKLAGDVVDNYGWVMPRMWDDNNNNGFHSTNSTFPMYITFDLGGIYRIGDLRQWQRQDRIYKDNNVKNWEIYGSAISPTDPAFKGWVKLLDCTSYKPSGLPVGQTTQADITYAAAGQLFTFPANTPVVRYIRYKVNSVWGSDLNFAIMEVTFRGW